MSAPSTAFLDVSGATPPPPRPGLVLPPRAATGTMRASEVARRSPISHLRYVGLTSEKMDAAVSFYEGIWGLYRTGSASDVVYLGAASSTEPFILRLRASGERRTDVVAFGSPSAAAVDALATRLGSDGIRLVSEPGPLAAPGGGYGVRFFDPDGRVVEVSSDVQAKPTRPLEAGESVPARLSHVVINSPNVPIMRNFYETYLGLRLSDWIVNRMCFLRCATDHHSLAISTAPTPGINHVSFEMRGIDEYMRGTGRMVRGGYESLWGPGRHGAGDNVFSYFAGPDDFVVEYTTALEQVLDEDSWVPRVWPATPDYKDRWGTGGPGEDLFALSRRTSPESGLWTPAPV